MQRYQVVRGDNLSKIARRHGLKSWREIYFHPANQSFRQRRPNPNLIHPGDALLIPSQGAAPARTPAGPARAQPVQSDEADLKTAPAEIALQEAAANPSGRQWLADIGRTLKQLPFDAAQTMHRNGVLAIFFGRAAVVRRGERHVRTELDGIQIKVKTTPEASRHNGAKLYKNDRLSTLDGGSGILFFLPDLSMIEVKSGMEILVSGRSNRRARRMTRPAHLERGTLRDRLSEL